MEKHPSTTGGPSQGLPVADRAWASVTYTHPCGSPWRWIEGVGKSDDCYVPGPRQACPWAGDILCLQGPLAATDSPCSREPLRQASAAFPLPALPPAISVASGSPAMHCTPRSLPHNLSLFPWAATNRQLSSPAAGWEQLGRRCAAAGTAVHSWWGSLPPHHASYQVVHSCCQITPPLVAGSSPFPRHLFLWLKLWVSIL